MSTNDSQPTWGFPAGGSGESGIPLGTGAPGVPPTPAPGAPTAPVPPSAPEASGAFGSLVTPTSPETAGATPTRTRPGHSKGKKPLWLWIGGGAVVAIAIAAGVIIALNGGDDSSEPVAAPTVTVTAPVPTATTTPIERTATTTFATELPSTLLQYALATSVVNADWQGQGAAEAYTETYTDGASGSITIDVGQWRTTDAAVAFVATLAAGPADAPADDPAAGDDTPSPTPTASATKPATSEFTPTSGDVTAGGTVVGQYTITDNGDGTGTAIWTNGTTVIRAVAPLAEITNVYAAYSY